MINLPKVEKYSINEDFTNNGGHLENSLRILLKNIALAAQDSNYLLLKDHFKSLTTLGEAVRLQAGPRGTIVDTAQPRLSKPILDYITELLYQDPSLNEEVVGECLLTLGEWGGKESVSHLDKYVKSADERLKTGALRGLSTIGGPMATKTLLDFAKKGSDVAKAELEELCLGGVGNWRIGYGIPSVKGVEPDIASTLWTDFQELLNSDDRLKEGIRKELQQYADKERI